MLPVLVVDDNADAADSLALVLTAWGCQPIVARNGADALEAARRHGPKLALLDLKMAGMDGYALAQGLRAELGPHLVLVAVTGLADETYRRRSREAGFALHLVKPIDLDQLRALLDRLGPPA